MIRKKGTQFSRAISWDKLCLKLVKSLLSKKLTPMSTDVWQFKLSILFTLQLLFEYLSDKLWLFQSNNYVLCPSVTIDIQLALFMTSRIFLQVMLRLAEAEWSDKFSLDTVGSSGNVTCKVKATGGAMEVGLSVKELGENILVLYCIRLWTLVVLSLK